MMNRNPKRKSTKQRHNIAPQVTVQRSTFDLSYPWKCTFDSGLLIPMPPIEILPGDSFRVRLNALARLATPLHPTMDNLHMETWFFFVPNRLSWKNWQKFMGEQDNPGDSTDFTIPKMIAATYSVGSTWDYMGIPTDTPNPITISALPNRAMARVWNEWFRDENLQDAIVWDDGDGPDINSNYGLKRRGKRRDYISSSLPWPQKGPEVNLPLGTKADIATDASTGGALGVISTQAAGANRGLDAQNIYVQLSAADQGSTLYADLSTATAATINELREAFQIQKLQERDARGGTRYIELLKSHFGVTSPDHRLQRSEYLGGGYSAVQMNTVPQTSSTDATTPQGNLSAYGTATMQGHGFTKSFVEHGYVVGFVCIRADLNYQQRLDKHWSRNTRLDYYFPVLQALGEQAVLNKEVWMDGSAADDDVWGYQERWAEYRSNLGKICGKFRSNTNGTLDPWHYALDYQTRPALDSVFIEDVPPVKRTVAVQNEPEFLFDAYFDIRAARPMPVYSVPGYIDHF